MAQPTPQPHQSDPRMAAYLRQQALNNEQAMRQQQMMQQEIARQAAASPEQMTPAPQQPAVEQPIQPQQPEIQPTQPQPVQAEKPVQAPGAEAQSVAHQESRTTEQIAGLTAGQPDGVMPVIPTVVPEVLDLKKVSDGLEASADGISTNNLSEGAAKLEEAFGDYIEKLSDPNQKVIN